MSLHCAIDTCKRPSAASCNLCKKNLCHEHLKEHDDWIYSEVNRLVEEMKTISNRYHAIDRNKLINDSRQKLDKWRDDAYIAIERTHKEKCRELDRVWVEKITKPQKETDRLQSRFNEFIRKKKVTHDDIYQSTLAIRYMDRQIKDIEQNGIAMSVPMLYIDNNLKSMNENDIEEIDQFQLLSSYRSVDCSAQSGVAFATNNQNLFVYEYDFLNLYNQDLINTQKLQWRNGNIYDICWSTILNSFIVITDKRTLYAINENTLTFRIIHEIPQEKWWSSTCSDKYLFLSTCGTDANIYLFNLSASFELVKRWRSPDTCKQYESIHDIEYANESLAIVVADSSSKAARLELRSSKTLTPFWSFTININHISYQPSIHCCQIKYSEWLVVIENTPNIFHISKDGKLKRIFTYEPLPWNILRFTSSILAIRTENHLFLHNI